MHATAKTPTPATALCHADLPLNESSFPDGIFGGQGKKPLLVVRVRCL